jgi:hypothetical protein
LRRPKGNGSDDNFLQKIRNQKLASDEQSLRIPMASTAGSRPQRLSTPGKAREKYFFPLKAA